MITYISDLTAFRAELEAVANDPEHVAHSLTHIDEDGKVTFNVSKIPVYYANEDESLCLITGVSRSVIEAVASIEILGDCISNKYVFDSDAAQATYERVYDTSPKTITDEDGNEYTYTPPYMIGVFA